MRVNPFQPNYPINPAMFVGRVAEIERIERHLLQTRSRSPSNFLITGERGIGKSSLLRYAKAVARGDVPVEDQRLNFLVVETDIDASTKQIALAKKIRMQMDHVLGSTEPGRNFLKNAWRFIQRVEVAGVKIKPGTDDEATALEEFALDLAEACNRICGGDAEQVVPSRCDGVLLLIDEADDASTELGLGSYLKQLLERLQRAGCESVCVGLAGLPEVRGVLHDSHPSSLRMFEELDMNRLTDEESAKSIRICLEHGAKQNPQKTEIDDDALRAIIRFSEGYPHFVQQFGYCSFEADLDNLIDHKDSLDGAVRALDILGDRYYRADFYEKIKGESYRKVLRIMADCDEQWVKKSTIREKFDGTQTVLDNAIKALRDRRIIVSKEGERGVYRLQQRAFALWIQLYSERGTLDSSG